MTAITITPDMTLRDIAMEAYRTSPSGVDFTQTPDGNITFTNAARPGEEFRFGPDTMFADSVVWGTWAQYPEGDWDCTSSTGCEVADMAELATALTEWIDRSIAADG